MIKNNIRALIYHILMIFLATLILFGFKKISDVLDIKLNNIIVKLIIVALFFFAYYYFGKLMSLRINPKYDFLNGLIIAGLGLLLFMFGYLGLGSEMFNIELIASLWKMPFDIFMSPVLVCYTVLGIKYNLLLVILALLLPGIIMGFGFRKRRIKVNKIRRRRKIKSMNMNTNQ
ncbi:MAG: hypothetical protein GXZ08_06195 [Tissierellia bacterium]|nr:hypothetical protein [Tissierellia bacterium]